MTSRERIGTAQTSDNLGEVGPEDIGDIDIVRACGLAGAENPLGLSIFRWRYGGDQKELPRVYEALIARGEDPHMVARVLAHLASDICLPCEGRGYKVVAGTPMLSDEACECCQGAGRRAVTGEKERDLVERIARMEREVAADIMKRIARQLEF
jgi:hypothetical protein